MSIKINIDVAAIAAQFKEFAVEAEQEFIQGVKALASMTHAKVAELASQELKSSLKTLQDNLKFEEVSDGIWVVAIDEDALWIEEGLDANFDMKPGLLRDGETAKDGHKYRVVPFEHSKAPSQMNGYAQNLVDRIKSELKQQKVPFKKIEKNAQGSPRVGLLHEFNFGGETPGKGNTPVLDRLRIYQTQTPGGGVRRDIFTFRTVSDKPNQKDKWLHPGVDAKKFLDRAVEWAMKEWETKVLPDLMTKVMKDWG
jgi:hypothetical protein